MPKYKDEESIVGSSQSPQSFGSSTFRNSNTSTSSLELEAQEVENAITEKGREFHRDRLLDSMGMEKGLTYIRSKQPRGGYSLCQVLLTVFTTIFCCTLFYLWLQWPQGIPAATDVVLNPAPILGPQAPTSNAPKKAGKKRHAVIISSFLQQNISWTKDLVADWEIVPYIMDDPDAQYVVPRNQGREAMAYTTYIVDHYDDLPDHMVFIHGHVSSWHQIEPIVWKLNSLNFTALEQDGYVSLRCTVQPGCGIKEVDLTIPRKDRTEPWDIYMPLFFQKTFERAAAPRHIAAPCCAQFAVSKAAVQLHSKEWWIKFRWPMLRDLEDFEWGYGVDNWHIGLLYEKIWHMAFGKPAVYCPNEDYCKAVQWSNGVSCDIDREPLYTESYGWEHIKCHRNYDLHPGLPVFGEESDQEM